jgi:hypothetical protein
MQAHRDTDKIARLKAMLNEVDDDHGRAAIHALIWELRTRQAEASGDNGPSAGSP